MRGTPQQIIDKYNQLARDAQLGNDRVAAENFQQHAEHYLRLLSEAQREQDQRREEQERQNRERQAERDRDRAERQEREGNSPAGSETVAEQPATPPVNAPQPDLLGLEPIDIGSGEESGLVETPEDKPKKASSPRKPRSTGASSRSKSSAKPKDEPAGEEAAEKPAPKSSTSRSRKPAAKKVAEADTADAAPASGGEGPSEAAE
ncbi:hypothetical protein GCM10010961_03200 [Pseudodonghicola xiamenensis]|uniref:DUF4167 domain-containing protein n=1 Tax=Pseudodonghicola xiamenensis TaxID=337702 RepID=A0A8J3H519_9RHOB|nr:hypothetical protein GCM10010961_03200 [Pseudodonghicola xiamenensis]